MLKRNRSLVDIDRDHLIHPVTSFRGHEARGATLLQSGKGMVLTDMDGHQLLDAFAGLWCVNVGYGHESIVEAAAEQMRRRGRQLALSLFELGESQDSVERQLLAWRYHPIMAREAASWAWDRHRLATDLAQVGGPGPGSPRSEAPSTPPDVA